MLQLRIWVFHELPLLIFLSKTTLSQKVHNSATNTKIQKRHYNPIKMYINIFLDCSPCEKKIMRRNKIIKFHFSYESNFINSSILQVQQFSQIFGVWVTMKNTGPTLKYLIQTDSWSLPTWKPRIFLVFTFLGMGAEHVLGLK